MSRNGFGVRAAAIALGVAALVGATAAPASAWPIPLTGEDTRFLNATRGHFPAADDDDTLLTAGRHACNLLYSRQGRQATIDQIAGEFGADPGQAANLVNAARKSYCTQAPG